MESLSKEQSPGSHSRRYSFRGVALDGTVSGESLSSMQPPGSRSLRCSLRGVTVSGPVTQEPHAAVQLALDGFVPEILARYGQPWLVLGMSACPVWAAKSCACS